MDPKATAKTLEQRPCTDCGRPNSMEARFCGACGHELASESQALGHEVMADPLVGRVIADRYRILQFLGRGGMGVVYRVEHVHIGKVMAMKLLHGELARDRDTIKRFRREAEAASKLSHPNTVQVFDFGSSQGLMYLVMEYVDGRDFGQLIREAGPLDFARVARLTAQVCASVAEAHRLGIVHRDIKPENVMIVERPEQGETAKVLDFGLAKLRDTQAGNTVTRAGAIVGTPYYMSPEQIRGEDVDARGDIYAIGAMMYKAITGAPPFVASTPMGVLTKHLTEALTPPSHKLPELPPEADVIIARAMEKEARDRYPDADALRAALVEYLGAAGYDMTDPSLALQSLDLSSSSRRRVAQLATRGDVEGFETRIQRRGAAAYALGALLLTALIALGVVYGRRYLASLTPPTEETEPNGQPTEASRLDRDVVVAAHLGRRVSETEGDVDFYRLARRGAGRQHLDIVVSGVPNVDMVVALVRVGSAVPAIEVDAGGVGEGESILAFAVQDDDYLVRVRQRVRPGARPVENVSDAYSIVWRVRTLDLDEEREPNDALETAGSVPLMGVVRGRIGWRNDVDLYCVDGSADRVGARVSGVPGLDLVLRVVQRAEESSTKVDAEGVGEGESVKDLRVLAGQTCFEVSVDMNSAETAGANPLELYVLEVFAGVDGG
ncbi:MAG: protein kinase [Myxococcales bacterium]|nr:protein kinase [Myxococcales bacterium]MCB9627447.1 protein kinase [Sandaracinaceae bacterium]